MQSPLKTVQQWQCTTLRLLHRARLTCSLCGAPEQLHSNSSLRTALRCVAAEPLSAAAFVFRVASLAAEVFHEDLPLGGALVNAAEHPH
eukprot:COSAG03_NODE_9175_length_737_cov_93.408736_1_plen_88_part_01